MSYDLVILAVAAFSGIVAGGIVLALVKFYLSRPARERKNVPDIPRPIPPPPRPRTPSPSE